MSGNNGKPDPIGAAIAAAETPPQVAMRQFNVVISSTGRPGAVVLPQDATDAEIAEFAGWLLTSVMNQHRAERAQSALGRLVIPSGPLPPRPAS